MNKTKVVNVKHDRYDIYIGRGSDWGNPYVIGEDGNRKEVIQKHKEDLLNNPKLMKRLPELNGKILGCFCKPESCHGDTYVELCDKL